MKYYIIMLLNMLLFSLSAQTTQKLQTEKLTAYETLEKLAEIKESNRYLLMSCYGLVGAFSLIYANKLDKDLYYNYRASTINRYKDSSKILFGVAFLQLIFISNAEREFKILEKSKDEDKNNNAYQKLNSLAKWGNSGDM